MRSRHKHDWPKENEKIKSENLNMSKYENFGPEARKFQIQKYKVIMGYKYLCEL